MRKNLLLVVLLPALCFFVGCANSFRYSSYGTCPGAVAQNNGKLAGAYSQSNFAVAGSGAVVENGFLTTANPYVGAPVYVVNGPEIYGEGGDNADGLLGGAQPVMLAANGHHYEGRGILGGGGGIGFNGPFRRNAQARKAMLDTMQDFNSGAYNYSSNNYNPYPGNTPTRGPRDFLAPNPPSIGP